MMKISSTKTSRYLRTLGQPIALVCLLAVMIILAADAFLNNVVNLALQKDAEQRAGGWTVDFVSQVPEIEELLETKTANDDQLSAISRMLAANNIFRFKLFGTDGTLRYVSDDPTYALEEDISEGLAEALRVLDTGTNLVSLNDGREKPNRPDDYVEAYVPAINKSGGVIGVIEVYVDVSAFAASQHGVFHRLSRFLIIGTAIVYLIPALVLVFRGQQVRERDGKLVQLSVYDPVTQALNRRSFAEKSALMFDQRDRIEGKLAVYYVDVDRFKNINDSYGHDMGDHVLGHVSKTIKLALPDEAIIARVGGDEFVILAPVNSEDDVAKIGDVIHASVSKPFSHQSLEISLSISVGAHLSPANETQEKALKSADLALYQSKANGRNCVVLYTSALSYGLERRRFIETCMRNSLGGQGGFYVEFQPIFRNMGREVAGFEALLRLRDSEGNPISPVEFIPIAEATGLIQEIGRKSMKCVMETALPWPGDVFVAVNLSAVQFRDGKLVETVAELLEETGFDPRRLELEVTEGLLLEGADFVGAQISSLKKLGADIALDDFGTGYSSLGYLWKYQFDKLKIDRVFLEGFDFHSAKYEKIISTIVSLGHNLDMKVTIEGVETEDQLKAMSDLGCDLFQGFLLGRPMSPEDALGIISQNQPIPQRKVSK